MNDLINQSFNDRVSSSKLLEVTIIDFIIYVQSQPKKQL